MLSCIAKEFGNEKCAEFGLLWELDPNSSHFEREFDLTPFFSKEYDRSRNKVLTIPYGLVARIAGFHPAGSGSIPGMGSYHNVFHERTFIFAFQLARIMLSKDFHVQVSTEY